jgi:hypothetical protein
MSPPLWRVLWRIAGRNGETDNVRVTWAIRGSLYDGAGSAQSATLTILLDFDARADLQRYRGDVGSAALFQGDSQRMRGAMRDVSFEPADGGRRTLVTFTLRDAEADDLGLWPQPSSWRQNRQPDDVVDFGFSTLEETQARTGKYFNDGDALPFAFTPRLRADVFGELPAPSDGQVWPYVFGSPGLGQDTAGTQYPAVPAYYLNESGLVPPGVLAINGGSPALLVNQGTGDAATLTLWGPDKLIPDPDLLVSKTMTVESSNVEGEALSWVDASFAALQPEISQTPEKRYYTSWPIAPRSGLAGDLLLQVYGASTLRIDYAEFERLRPIINGYKFSGYVDAPTLPTGYARAQILPLLPVEVVPGPRGLRPILWPGTSVDDGDQGVLLIDGQGIVRASPCQVVDLSPVSSTTVVYGLRADTGAYTRTVTVGTSRSPIARLFPSAMTTDEIESDIIHDDATASRVAGDRLSRRLLSGLAVSFSVVDFDRYGPGGTVELYVGRFVRLTSEGLGLDALRGIVSEVEATEGNVRITIETIRPLA